MSKREKPFHLDMPFGEALQRYAQTDPISALAKPKVTSKKKAKKRTKKKKHLPS